MRLYGEFEGQHSLARVGRGFLQALPEAHKYDLRRVGNDLDDLRGVQEGATDAVGVFVGSLGQLPEAFRATHEKLWVMVTPNSNKIGDVAMKLLENVKFLITPSAWAAGVLRRIFPDKVVKCVPHGLDPGFSPRGPRRPLGDEFRVLHLSSSELERKGTRQLVEAWAEVRLPNASLFISVPSSTVWYFRELVEELGVQESVKVTDRLDYSPEAMRKLYRSVDLVAQPSRGEGFGLVPLEARACGTPVLMTFCSGHSQHAGGPGCAEVATGDFEPIDDFPGAFAPQLTTESVARALASAYSERGDLLAEAEESALMLKDMWSWESQLKEFRYELFRSI